MGTRNTKGKRKNMDRIITIEKECLTQLHFATNEVLTDTSEIAVRNERLQKAVRLGNEYHGKVGIIFKLISGALHRVETTIWDCSDRFIALKGGVSIPLHAVYYVED